MKIAMGQRSFPIQMHLMNLNLKQEIE